MVRKEKRRLQRSGRLRIYGRWNGLLTRGNLWGALWHPIDYMPYLLRLTVKLFEMDTNVHDEK